MVCQLSKVQGRYSPQGNKISQGKKVEKNTGWEGNAKSFPIIRRRDKQGSDYENMLYNANKLRFLIGNRN